MSVYNLFLFLVFMAAAIGTTFLFAPTEDEAITRKRLREVRRPEVDPLKAVDQDLSRPFSERVIDPFLKKLHDALLRSTPSGLKDKLVRRLVQAGKPVELGAFVAYKLYAGLGLPLTLIWLLALLTGDNLFKQNPLVVVVLAFGGFWLPEVWLSRKIEKRRKALQKALPDVLDLLTVSVEAGLGFDGAVQKVSEKFPEPTAGEFQAYLKEIKLGKTREEALRSLTDRTGLPEIKSFSAALIQADKLGVSISKVLRVQSEQMRYKRKQKAEEAAMKLPVKMLFPLIFFIFPTIFIILLGPVIVHMMKLF
jgi:tight adherence protein C